MCKKIGKNIKKKINMKRILRAKKIGKLKSTKRRYKEKASSWSKKERKLANKQQTIQTKVKSKEMRKLRRNKM